MMGKPTDPSHVACPCWVPLIDQLGTLVIERLESTIGEFSHLSRPEANRFHADPNSACQTHRIAMGDIDNKVKQM
jgi:hypothetical protein